MSNVILYRFHAFCRKSAIIIILPAAILTKGAEFMLSSKKILEVVRLFMGLSAEEKNCLIEFLSSLRDSEDSEEPQSSCPAKGS